MQLTELRERCAKLETQCKAKHAAGEQSKAINNFNDRYNSVSCPFVSTTVSVLIT